MRGVSLPDGARPSPQPSPHGKGGSSRHAGNLCRARYVLSLAGPDGSEWFACRTQDNALSVVEVVLRALAESGARRMRDLPAAERAALVRRLELPSLSPRSEPSAISVCGLTDLGDGRVALLLDAPFGRCSADTLDELADRAEVLASDIHLSPSRGFALVTAEIAAARQARDALARLGFITQADDPRGAVAACPGAPACASGSTATLADAGRLAEIFGPFATLGLRAHVSGCAKGCAHPAAADLTLVGNDGLYAIVLGGPPSALPAMRLTFEAALERLRRADPSQALAQAFRIQP